jgi:hypothetical protein
MNTNAERRTPNAELRTEEGERNRQDDSPFSLLFDVGRSMFAFLFTGVECSMFAAQGFSLATALPRRRTSPPCPKAATSHRTSCEEKLKVES